LMHLPKPAMTPVLGCLSRVAAEGGWLAATLAQGGTSGVVTGGWLPGRFVARWRKEELARAVRAAGWKIANLKTVSNRERKGRWLVLRAQAQGRRGPLGPSQRKVK
jgi:hypothetical protein